MKVTVQVPKLKSQSARSPKPTDEVYGLLIFKDGSTNELEITHAEFLKLYDPRNPVVGIDSDVDGEVFIDSSGDGISLESAKAVNAYLKKHHR